MKRLSKRGLEKCIVEANADLKGLKFTKPVTRGDCLQGENAERPCPYVSCKHHTYLDVSTVHGGIKFNFPHLEVWEMKHSCSLDVADAGEHSLEEVGGLMALTRERVRQLEVKGLEKIKALDEIASWVDDLHEVYRPDLAAKESGELSLKELSIALARVEKKYSWKEQKQRAPLANRSQRVLVGESMRRLKALAIALGKEKASQYLGVASDTFTRAFGGDLLSGKVARRIEDALERREEELRQRMEGTDQSSASG